MKTMRVLVTGSRIYKNRKAVEDSILRIRERYPALIVIHGDCPTGADAFAQYLCDKEGIHTAKVSALWDLFKRKAGPLRNTAMVALEPHIVLAFGLSESKGGTIDCVKKARQAGIQVSEYA